MARGRKANPVIPSTDPILDSNAGVPPPVEESKDVTVVETEIAVVESAPVAVESSPIIEDVTVESVEKMPVIDRVLTEPQASPVAVLEEVKKRTRIHYVPANGQDLNLAGFTISGLGEYRDYDDPKLERHVGRMLLKKLVVG